MIEFQISLVVVVLGLIGCVLERIAKAIEAQNRILQDQGKDRRG